MERVGKATVRAVESSQAPNGMGCQPDRHQEVDQSRVAGSKEPGDEPD